MRLVYRCLTILTLLYCYPLAAQSSSKMVCYPYAWYNVQRQYCVLATPAPERRLINFVKDNYDHLVHEGARGQGEYLDALYSLLQLPGRQKSLFKQMVQRNFTELFRAGDPNLFLTKVRALIASDSLTFQQE